MRPIGPMLIRGTGGGGGGGGLDAQDVVNGGGGIIGERTRGFNTGVMGSITDGTSNLYSGAVIRQLWMDEGGGSPMTIFQITGTVANTGWTTMTVNSTDYLRTAATFSSPGGNSQWVWASGGASVWGAVGNTAEIVWT